MKQTIAISVALLVVGTWLSPAQAHSLEFTAEGWGILPAFMFGLIGSTHCLGMCGPLVSLYSKDLSSNGFHRQHLLYNLGRVIVYTDLGILLGFLGWGLAVRPWVSMVIGTLAGGFVIAMGFYFLRLGSAALWLDRALAGPTARLARLWRGLQRAARSRGVIALGALHGLLPCPLLYVMFSSAIALQSPLQAGLLLLSFSLGTVPMMWGIGFFASRLSLRKRDWLQRVFGAFIILWGLVLLLHAIPFQ